MLTPSQLIRIFATLPSPKGHCWVPLPHWLQPYCFLNGTIKCFKADLFFPQISFPDYDLVIDFQQYSISSGISYRSSESESLFLCLFVLLFVSEALEIEFRAVWMFRQASSYLATPQPFPPLSFNGFRCHSQRTIWWNLFSSHHVGLGVELQSSGVAASAFTRCASSYAPTLHS